MVRELMGWDFTFVLMEYGALWRKHRKLMHQSFNPAVVSKFKPHIMKATHTLMRNLLAKPDDFKNHIQHMVAEVILLITYGINIREEADPYVELPDKSVRAVSEAAVPGRFLVDAIPWLKHVPEWVPFASFQRLARECRQYTRDGYELPYQAAKKDILAGSAIDSLVSDGLQETGHGESNEDWEDTVKRVAGTTYIAGTDTTVSSLLNGVLALMCYPEALKKAQAEIDRVVKPGHLPDFNDRESLPYLSALIKEMLRWYPVLPLGVVHYTESEDVYKGYCIPAHTMVSANIWGILHDETVYPNPSKFNPDRFLKDGKLDPNIQDPEDIVFGFGRRVCAGKHFAELSVWMTAACLVSLFDISKPVGEDGTVIEPPLQWTSSSNPQPLPYKCKIVPRSKEAVAAIQRTQGYEYFHD
ncbi:hypothetical protein AX16_001486 [Volvariella volvacea WC 439]|nr:hypothetical protein AX16_001486 [Volvariella volvacea WC 439]